MYVKQAFLALAQLAVALRYTSQHPQHTTHHFTVLMAGFRQVVRWEPSSLNPCSMHLGPWCPRKVTMQDMQTANQGL